MNETYFWILAVALGFSGLLWATLRLRALYGAILEVWPDWDGRKSLAPFWALFALGLGASALAAALLSQTESPSAAPAPTTAGPREIALLESEIGRLKNLLNESTEQIANQTPASEPASEPKASENSEPEPPSGPGGTPVPSAEVAQSSPTQPETKPVSAPTKPKLDPKIEAISKAVINAVISGSVKPLEAIAHPTLLGDLTVDPFEYSRLQTGLKQRLAEGYRPTYLDKLESLGTTTYVWKIKTVSAGPDILQRLAINQGKVTGFRFDGLQ